MAKMHKMFFVLVENGVLNDSLVMGAFETLLREASVSETDQFSSKGIVNFIGNFERVTAEQMNRPALN